MGLFSKKLITCPICDEGLPKNENKFGHWESHCCEFPPGEGDASGQFTWECNCGPSGMKWPHVGGAAARMALHMQQRHGISL